MSKNKNLPETEDYGNDIVTLVDENGKTIRKRRCFY